MKTATEWDWLLDLEIRDRKFRKRLKCFASLVSSSAYMQRGKRKRSVLVKNRKCLCGALRYVTDMAFRHTVVKNQ